MSWLTFGCACFFLAWCVMAGFDGRVRDAATSGAIALLLLDLSWRRATR